MGTHNQRVEYGKKLVELGGKNADIVVLEADLGKSTMSSLFEEAFPDRYFEMGIAEQNMTSFAGGLALAGKIPFTNTFAVFASGRAYDQIRQSIATAKLNVKVVGSSSGMSDFGDGATHQSIDDVAIMSAVPNMTVFTPCDGIETGLAVEAAAALDGPCYIRLCRNDLEDIYPVQAGYRIGEPVALREGVDVAVYTHGIMAHAALAAAQMAQEEGISAAVIHIPTIKPLREDLVRKLAEGKKGVVVCEEASIQGGLNMLVSYILRGTGIPVESMAVMDVFGQSGSSHQELLAYYELDAESVLKKIRKAVVLP
ncbi:MAG: transketolase family protein [Lachnospiraceae bacterium]|nr:transketolase family protein [Lachnospiraceae bacterium]